MTKAKTKGVPLRAMTQAKTKAAVLKATKKAKVLKARKCQGTGKYSQGQEQAKDKSRGLSKGKDLCPSPGTGQGKAKGAKAKGEGKAPKTPEDVKQISKQRRENMSMSDRSNMHWDPSGYRVPYYHRRQRVRPGQLRGITDNFIPKWKKRQQEGSQYLQSKKCFLDTRVWKEKEFPLHVDLMRLKVGEAFTHILPAARIIEDITGQGSESFRAAQLWKGGRHGMISRHSPSP